jgi:hypothetical protein
VHRPRRSRYNRGMRPTFPRRLIVQIPLILAIVALPPAPFPSCHKVSLANFRRIKLGMAVREVDDIFGFRGYEGPCRQFECDCEWREGPNIVGVSFGQFDGKATCASFFSYADHKQCWLPRAK